MIESDYFTRNGTHLIIVPLALLLFNSFNYFLLLSLLPCIVFVMRDTHAPAKHKIIDYIAVIYFHLDLSYFVLFYSVSFCTLRCF